MARDSGRFLIWSYTRGTLPYDIICILILAFIFLIPRGCFVRRTAEPPKPPARQTDGRDGAARHPHGTPGSSRQTARPVTDPVFKGTA